MRTIALYNMKGGVGKTVTAANLAHLYVTGRTHRLEGTEQGAPRRALLLDCDPQGNLSMYFKRYDEDKICGLRCGEAVETDWAGLDIMTGNRGLCQYEEHMRNHHDLTALKKLLEKRHGYDLAIIDCPPGFGMLTINALIAADYIIIPTYLDAFSAQGLDGLDEQLHDIRKLNPRLKLLGVVVNNAENNETSRKVEGALRKNLPVFKTRISHSKWISTSMTVNMPLAELEKANGKMKKKIKNGMSLKPSWQYRALMNEILEEMK